MRFLFPCRVTRTRVDPSACRLARWINAPTTGLELINENIVRNHHVRIFTTTTFNCDGHSLQGQFRGKWLVGVRSYRSTFSTIPGLNIPAERAMCALTMNENVFVLLDDPASPGRTDLQNMHAQPTDGSRHPIEIFRPPHFRSTFLTLNPPGALEQLLAHLRARWVPVRQTVPGNSQRGQPTGQQLVIEGKIFSIGSDWIVRVGNVILSGGAVKGILLEVITLDYIYSRRSNSYPSTSVS
jgi:TATA-binding related factor (TRF) of subunit 20 of Mediator complex